MLLAVFHIQKDSEASLGRRDTEHHAIEEAPSFCQDFQKEREPLEVSGSFSPGQRTVRAALERPAASSQARAAPSKRSARAASKRLNSLHLLLSLSFAPRHRGMKGGAEDSPGQAQARG